MAHEYELTPERELETIDLNINIGPQHPATHGVFRMVIEVDGEVVTDVVPHIGYMHRGGEKLSENMDYRQAIGYQDRTEYLAQFNAELCYVQAIEKLAGLVPPERAEYIRVILAELNRISSHFMFLGAFGTDLGVLGTAFTYAFRERENLLDLFEEVSGDRLMYAYFRPGGVAWDVPNNFKERVQWVVKQALVGADDLDRLLTDNEIFISRTLGIGRLSAQDAIDFGVTGPALRASGVKFDLRKDDPYSIYDRFDFDIPTGKNGDSYDRYLVRMEEFRQSNRIIRQCVDWLRRNPGPVMIEDHKIAPPKRVGMKEDMEALIHHFKLFTEGYCPPAGEVYAAVEAPKGEFGIYLVSDGANKPYRVKIRAPGFAHLSAMDEMAKGHMIADVVAIIGTMDIVFGEVDR
jgi:NADH-quinone oxidoreductase subunit D